MDKQNRRQWKCQTIESTDWSSRENAGKWRKNLADTINATNEQLGIAVHWEHRSYAEQGIDKLPTIHLGSIASALERKGIQTDRGNINRAIMARNKAVESARQMLSNATAKLFFASADKVKESVSEITGEIAELIDRVIRRKGRLDLPIVKGKYLAKVTDRAALQSGENAKRFISEKKISTFDNLAAFTDRKEKEYAGMEQLVLSKTQKIKRLQNLSEVYAEYAKYRDIYRQSQDMKGLSKLKYDHEHKAALEAYPHMKERMQKLLKEGEKLSPKQWRAEIQTLQKEYAQAGKAMAATTMELAYAEVIRFNKKNLEREMENESHAKNRQRTVSKNQEELL